MADEQQEQQQEPEKPRWDVSTHGPLPERLKDVYQEVGQPPAMVDTGALIGVPQAASPDGEHVGDRVVEGPADGGDGQPAADTADTNPKQPPAKATAQPAADEPKHAAEKGQ